MSKKEYKRLGDYIREVIILNRDIGQYKLMPSKKARR